MISSISARSSADRARGPATRQSASRRRILWGGGGTEPWVETRPQVVLWPKIPQAWAGQRIEPPRSDAELQRRHAAGDRRRRAARRAARRKRRIERMVGHAVNRVIGLEIAGEHRRVRFAEDDGAGLAQPRDGGSVGRRTAVLQRGRADAGGEAGDVECILDADRQAFERARLRRARCAGRIRRRRPAPRPGSSAISALSRGIDRRDPRQRPARQLDAGDLARQQSAAQPVADERSRSFIGARPYRRRPIGRLRLAARSATAAYPLAPRDKFGASYLSWRFSKLRAARRERQATICYRLARVAPDRERVLMAIAAVLFDKDGTLIDFDRTWGPAIHAVMGALPKARRPRCAPRPTPCISHWRTSAFARPRRSSPVLRHIMAKYGDGPSGAPTMRR